MHYLSTSAPFHLSYLLAPTSVIPPPPQGAVPPTLGTTGLTYRTRGFTALFTPVHNRSLMCLKAIQSKLSYPIS